MAQVLGHFGWRMAAGYSCATCTLHNSSVISPFSHQRLIISLQLSGRGMSSVNTGSRRGRCHPGRCQARLLRTRPAPIRHKNPRSQKPRAHYPQNPPPEAPTSHPCILVISFPASVFLVPQAGASLSGTEGHPRSLKPSHCAKGEEDGKKAPGNLTVSFRLCLFRC